MRDVFISHSRADNPIAHRLTDDLRDAGLTVWIDEKVQPGQNWAATISEAIDSSKNILILLSEHSAKSDWVRSEAALAFSKKEKRVIPVLLSRNADIPIILRSLQSLDLSEDERYESNVELLEAIS